MRILNYLFAIRFLIPILIIFTSCKPSNDSSAVQNHELSSKDYSLEVTKMEDSLNQSYQKIMSGELDSIPYPLINRIEAKYIAFYNNFAKDSLTPIYLDRLQQLYLQEKKYLYAVNWVDTVMLKYPTYDGMNLMLYNAGNTADLYLNDTNRVKKYYNSLLGRSPKLKKEIRSEVENRLSNLSKSIIQLHRK